MEDQDDLSAKELADTEMHSDDDHMSDQFDEIVDDEEEEEPPIDDSIAQLVGHSKDVFCLALSSSKRWIASGSEDDTACVWDLDNTESSEPYLRIVDHSDSVNSVEFNASSTLLATADMSGCIICTTVSEKARRCKIEDCSDVEWILWHDVADILFAGTAEGFVWMWLIGKSGVQQSKIYSRGAGAACTKGRLLPDAKRLLAVYADGEARLWDLKSGETVASVQMASACFCLDVHAEKPWAAIGCADGTTALLNTDNNKVVTTFGTPFEKSENDEENSAELDESNSVEMVCFAPAFPWLAVATAGGELTVYDVENGGVARHTCSHDGHAVVSTAWRETASLATDSGAAVPTAAAETSTVGGGQLQILSICMDGGVRMWDAKSGEPIKANSCGGCGVFDFCIVEKNGIARTFVACSGGVIRVFEC